jgi:VCBS repeat-containing protein
MMGCFPLLLAGMLVLTGCPTDGSETPADGELSFESFASPSVIVDNLTGQRLVAFKGSLNPNYMISGIPAYASSHGLKKNAALFTTTGDFVLVLITEEQYNANKNNLGSLENLAFARIFAFYNNSGTNNNHFQISSKIGGSGRLSIVNPTPYNVEIRSGGPTGEILGYAPREMTMGTVLYLNGPDVYDIYPVFKFFNHNDGELYSVVPKFTAGALQGKPFGERIVFEDGAMNKSFNMNKVSEAGSFNLSSGGVYIRVVNNADTAVSFLQGGEERTTSTGVKSISPARSNMFTIQITRNTDGTYPEDQAIAQLTIEAVGNSLSIPSQRYKLDYMYEIEVLGDNASVMELGPMEEKEKIDLDKIFGM